MSNKRRSARHLLGASAEVHVGPQTVVGVVKDVSAHGMGLMLPSDLRVNTGDIVWVLANDVATYAITGTVKRSAPGGVVGIEFDEILSGASLDKVDCLPLTEASEELGTQELPTRERSSEPGVISVNQVLDAAAEIPTQELPDPKPKTSEDED